MFEKRIIPLLLVKDRKLVKTIRFRKDNYIGDPINAARIFSDREVDELILCDKSANINGVDFQLIEDVVSECFIPITYAGGIKDIETMTKLYRLGVEKIAIDSQNYIDGGQLLESASKKFGASSVVAGVTLSKNLFGKKVLYSTSKKSNVNIDIGNHISQLQTKGAGEIFINDALSDGLMQGYSLDYIKELIEAIEVPITICGGAGSIDHLKQLLSIKKVTGAAAGSLFVYSSKNRGILINYPDAKLKEILVADR